MDLSVVTTANEGSDYSWLRSRAGAIGAIPGTIDVTKLTAGTHYDAYGVIPGGLALTLNPASGLYEPWAASTSEIQTATISGVPTGGAFTLIYAAPDRTVTTAAIAFNATAAQVQAALIATGIFAAGDVVVTGSAGGPYTITFGGRYAGENVPQMTSTNTFTGGASPTVTVTTGTGGGTVPATDGVLDGVLLEPLQLLNVFTTLVSAVVEGAIIKTGEIIPAKMPLAPALNTSTPTTCTFVYINVPHA
jgi:hypothetical protein